MNQTKNTIRNAVTPLVIALAVVLGMLIGRSYKNQSSNSENRFVIYPQSNKLSNVINYITDKYVDEVDKSELIETAIPKVLSELDPHSQYIPAEELRRVNEPLQGNFSGIGVQFNMLNDTLMVIKTIANGPSEKVGILAGDRFITVDDDTVAGVGIPSDSIVGMLKGPRGTKVKVGVQRKYIDGILSFTITRDNIPLHSVDVAYMIDSEIGYIRINKFARTTFEEFSASIIDLHSKGMKKLILDLRGNGGGYLNAAVNIADQFFANQELIVYTEGNSQDRESYYATKGGLCTNLEVNVLIDENSASASEILAGAIQDNDRGTIIGRRSFGKGLVQDQTMLSDGSAIRLTIARYYTPTGRCIQKSYTNGSDEYYSELMVRYSNGELLEKDSIHFDDSLKYTTPEGRTVYGGGGIMPDIFVPIDTTDVTDYLIAVRNRGLIYRFALEYSDDHREELQGMKDVDEILAYLKKKNVLNEFIRFAAKNEVPRNYSEIQTSKYILEIQLNAYIVRNILDDRAFYPILEEIDDALQIAIDEFKKDEV